MSGDSKFFLGVVIAAILVVGGFVTFSGKDSSNVKLSSVDSSGTHKLGPDSAPVKIVEFGDFQCPACATAAVDFEKAQANNADNVQIIFRHFPLPNHQNGMNSSIAAQAAGAQDKFWLMLDLLYANQRQWERLDNPLDTFVAYAKELNLNTEQFKSDYQNPDTKKAVEQDRDYGLSINVDSTPTFYLNNVRYTGGRTAADWQKLIDEALSIANTKPTN